MIYIDSEVKIPIEVECFTHIERGSDQLKKYQKDFERKYGILTDGFSWRFYNNEIVVKEFTIEEIFGNLGLFLSFWNEYIKPVHYYSTFFESDVNELAVERNKNLFFEDTTFLIKNFKNKLQIEGYFNDLEKEKGNKEATQMAYSYLIQFILYKTLVDNEFDDFKRTYDEKIKKISTHIKNEGFRDIFGIIKGMSSEISKNIYRPFKEEQLVIVEKLTDVSEKTELNLSDISPWLDIFIYIKKYNFRNIQNEIFGFIYENYLKELFSDEERGQYFTDPNVVNFMIKEVGYTPLEIKKKINNNQENKLSIIDPACGSGTFLYTATDSLVHSISDGATVSNKIKELVSNNVFGLDIEEFPLYLAEMSILMRLLPFIINERYNNPFDKKIKVFKTEDSISEFIGSGIDNIKNGQINLLSFQEPSYKSFMRDQKDIDEMKESLIPHQKFPRRRFDYVIANPPYIAYNKCAKQGLPSFKLIKKGKFKLNNIYGMNLHSVPGNPKRYRPNPNLYAFFVALGLALLKHDGKLCYIIPQTVLVNPDLDVVRYHLAKYSTIEKIIAFRGKLFINRGLNQVKEVPTSSLILVVSNKIPTEKHNVEIVIYNKTNETTEEIFRNVSIDKNTTKRIVANTDLLKNISSWNFIKLGLSAMKFLQKYKANSEDINIYYEHAISESKFGNKFYFDGGYSIDEKNVLNEPADKNIEYYRFPRLNDSFWTIKEEMGYWPNVRSGSSKLSIKLRQGNQGYMFLDSKYKLIWSYNNTTKFFFTDAPLIWARNKILGIGSENKKELYYLFAILNSKVTNFLLTNFVKIEQEETRTILVSLQIIKDLIYVPKINEKNQRIKEEIINNVEELLHLDERKLSDFVDFSGILIQKFDEIKVDKDKLLLIKSDDIITRKISYNTDIIKDLITSTTFTGGASLSEIKNLQVIDSDRQNEIKQYVDDLVFALYFDVDIKNIGLKYAKEINGACRKNKLYSLLSS